MTNELVTVRIEGKGRIDGGPQMIVTHRDGRTATIPCRIEPGKISADLDLLPEWAVKALETAVQP